MGEGGCARGKCALGRWARRGDRMFRQILIPLDGSAPAERALPIARALARDTHAVVHLVRVVPLPEPPWTVVGSYLPPSTFDDLLTADQRAATAYLEDSAARLDGRRLAVCTATLAGDAAGQLLLYERERGIDLVVLGFQCHGGPARLTLGPVTTQLLRHGRAPLLLVLGTGNPACLEHALVPLDGSSAHEEALRTVTALAPAVVRQVSLLRVVPDAAHQPAAERYLEKFTDRLDLSRVPIIERSVAVGSAAQAISTMAAGRLLVMATHAHMGLTHWFGASVTEHVLHHHVEAVLLVRTGAPAPMDELR